MNMALNSKIQKYGYFLTMDKLKKKKKKKINKYINHYVSN